MAALRRRRAAPRDGPDFLNWLAQVRMPGRSPRYVERRDLIAAVEEGLDQGRWVVLTGPPGSGKTRVAADVAFRRAGVPSGRRDGYVHWCDGRSSAALAGDLATLAIALDLARLGQPTWTRSAIRWCSGDTDRSEVVGEYHRPEDLLLVVDGATDLQSLRRWLPDGAGPQVLVTADMVDADLPPTAAVIPVGELTEPEALHLLGTEGAAEVGRAVLAAIGRLPLTVALAASTLRSRGITAADYRGLLPSAVDDVGDVGDVGAAVVDLAVASLATADEMGIVDLHARILSVLSPSGVDLGELAEHLDVSEVFVIYPRKKPRSDLLHAVNRLLDWDLLTTNVAGNWVWMHPCVARAIRRRMDPGTLAAAIHLALTAYGPQIPVPTILDTRQTRWVWEHWRSQVEALAEAGDELLAVDPSINWERVVAETLGRTAALAGYLLTDCDLERAGEALGRLTERQRRLAAIEDAYP